MLRPDPLDRLVKATLIATLASLGIGGGLLATRALDRPTCVVAPPPPPALERVMWATSVRGSSSQYSDQSWSAQHALGAPDVYPQHGDIPQAWASRTADDQDEWIEVGYDQPRSVSALEIYETFNPGAVASVELVTASGRRIQLRAPAPGQAVLAHRTTIAMPCTSEPIAAVRINLSSATVPGWNEIDAIGLVPCSR